MLLLSALAALDLAVELFGSQASEPSSGKAFLALLAFLLSFVLVRINTRVIRNQWFSW